MNKYLIYLHVAYKLGIANVLYILWYRVTLKTGIRKYFFPVSLTSINGDIFHSTNKAADFPESWKIILIKSADELLKGKLRYYAYHQKDLGNPPDWFLNPFTNTHYPEINQHWTKLPDFHPLAGDIKNIWEPSRFEWLVTLARAYSVSEKSDYLTALNTWMNDWLKKNPLNTGPNWKCGQEASIRVFNLINASFILNQWEKPTNSLIFLINVHLQRILANIRYAMAQDNNHGTSEAAALFIGGAWLLSVDPDSMRSKKYCLAGRKYLEERVTKLIENDGSFSQHSVTYHRVLLDTLVYTEFWRQKLEQRPFSKMFYTKAKAAIDWLWLLTDEISGNCPNLGANDGALFMNTHSCDYRDFRPSLQTSSVIFNKNRFFDNGPWDEPLFWFGTEYRTFPILNIKRKSLVIKNFYTLIKSDESWAIVRIPHFKFRPSHNDVFHFDLWYRGRNILHDSGSYSYYPLVEEPDTDLSSVHAHNTISFDNYDQMPRISRFLSGCWIKDGDIGSISSHYPGEFNWQGSYADNRGNIHIRAVSLSRNIWTISDEISGRFLSASIGYNISSVGVQINGNIIETEWGKIYLPHGTEYKISETCSSDYYWENHTTNRLSIIVNHPQKFVTKIELT